MARAVASSSSRRFLLDYSKNGTGLEKAKPRCIEQYVHGFRGLECQRNPLLRNGDVELRLDIASESADVNGLDGSWPESEIARQGCLVDRRSDTTGGLADNEISNPDDDDVAVAVLMNSESAFKYKSLWKFRKWL